MKVKDRDKQKKNNSGNRLVNRKTKKKQLNNTESKLYLKCSKREKEKEES